MSGNTASVDRSNQPSGRWMLTEEQLARLPSIVDGLSADEETRSRQKAASFITEMAERLNQNVKDRRSRISQLCICTAMMFMHRFFTVHSMRKFDCRDIAAACLLLAGKSEETPRKLEYIVQIWWQLKFSNQVILDKNRYFDAAQLIVTLEDCVLQTLGFDLTVEVPHPFVLTQMSAFKVSTKIIQTAYWFATDILHITNWGVRFHASVLACICIACTWAEFDFPQKTVEKPWYNKISSSLSEEELLKLSDEFTTIYRNCSESLAIKKFAVRNGVVFDRSTQRSTTSSTTASGSSENAGQPVPSVNGSGAPMLPPPPAPPSLEKRNGLTVSEYKRSNIHPDEAQKQSSNGSSSQQPRKSFMSDTAVVKNVPGMPPAFGKDGSKVKGRGPPPSSNAIPPTPSDDRHRRKETFSSSHHRHQSSGSRHFRTEGDRPAGSASSSSAPNQQQHHRKRDFDRINGPEQHSNGSRHFGENGNPKRPRPSLASANDATPPYSDLISSRPYGNGSSKNGPTALNSGFPAAPTKNAFGASSDDLEDGEIN